MSKKMNAGEAAVLMLQISDLLKNAPYSVLDAVGKHVLVRMEAIKKPNPKVKAVTP